MHTKRYYFSRDQDLIDQFESKRDRFFENKKSGFLIDIHLPYMFVHVQIMVNYFLHLVLNVDDVCQLMVQTIRI